MRVARLRSSSFGTSGRSGGASLEPPTSAIIARRLCMEIGMNGADYACQR